MIDIALLRERPDYLKESLDRRGLDLDVDLMAHLDQARRSTRATAESMRADQKSLSRRIPRLEGEARQDAIAKAGELAAKYRTALAEADDLDRQFRELWVKVPNPAHPSAADGLVEEDAVEIKRWGDIPEIAMLEFDRDRLKNALARRGAGHRRQRLVDALPGQAKHATDGRIGPCRAGGYGSPHPPLGRSGEGTCHRPG